MPANVRFWVLLGFAVGLLGVGAGCGRDDGLGAHIPVSGTVKLDGEPLKSGNIVFAPIEMGRGAQGTIVDGAFSISGAQAPSPGTHRVEIYSIQRTGKRVFDRGEGEMIEETKNLVPVMYNANSKLEAVVVKGGDNTFQFDLKVAKTK